MASSAEFGVSRLLAGIDVHPASLPDAAVLLVRRLADPAPRGVRIGEPGPRPLLAWERALQRAVERAAREAARPALGPVPPSAPAVVFLDPSELLACLARDLIAGDLGGAWWWQAWLRASGQLTLDRVVDAWVREARHVPAAVARLHARGAASTFAAALTPRHARALFVALAEAYEVPSLAAPVLPARTEAFDVRSVLADSTSTPIRGRESDSGKSALTDSADGAEPPWADVIPGASLSSSLGIEQLTFAGIALVLAHAPLLVRSRAFQHSFYWWRVAQSAQLDGKRPVSQPVERRASSDTRVTPPAARAGVPESDMLSPSLLPDGDVARAATVDAVTPAPAPDTAAGPARAVEDASPPPEITTDSAPRRRDETPQSEGTSSSAPTEASSASVGTRLSATERGGEVIQAAARRSEQHGESTAASAGTLASTAGEVPPVAPAFVTTDLGGVLFLVNALQHLKFWDYLDDRFVAVSTIGSWGWLEILSRSLIGDSRPAAAADPIWSVLAALDGREPGASFGSFRAPQHVRWPEEWPAPASGRPWRRKCRPLGWEPDSALQRFLDVLVPYLRWRLLAAMGLEERTADGDAFLASRLLLRRGRLAVTATHVDLRMGMDQVDIAVRLAGLDTNPGWVPALGRVVTFFFERE